MRKSIVIALENHQVIELYGICQNIITVVDESVSRDEFHDARKELVQIMKEAIKLEAKLGTHPAYPLELRGSKLTGADLYTGETLWNKNTEYGRTRWKVWNRLLTIAKELCHE